jgi:UDP-N-acetylglucosamine transferase subunit ALG13
MLAGRRVEFVQDTPPRDLKNVMRNVGAAQRILRRYRPDELVTNGAGVALSFAPLAAMQGVRTHYIECSARTEAPSVTGRILERIPRVRLYAQDPAFAKDRWQYSGSVFDRYAVAQPAVVPARGGVLDPAGTIRKVVVTVGSLSFSFVRLLTRLRKIIPPDAELLLQVGVDADRLEWDGAGIRATMAPDELDDEMASADVVIAHSGIGSALATLDAGKMPVLVPRLKRFGEHVDDHQVQIARTLHARGLAVMADASSITFEDLQRAARHRTETHRGRPFLLR